MADFFRDIPNGTMMIRDTGGWVEFWFKTGPSTFVNEQTWGYGANGQYWQGDYRLVRGGNWQKLGAVFVDARQDVLFRIFGEGVGWGTTDFVMFIERARQPDLPYPPHFAERSDTMIHAMFDYAYDGGMGIDDAEIWYSYDGTPRFVAQHTRDAFIGNLSPKTLWYFWSKVHNPIGWSGFSGRSEAWTLGVPDTPQPPDVAAVSQTQVRGGFRNPLPWDGGSSILEWQIGYGLDPNGPQAFRSGGDANLDGLQAGKIYYFWARGRNAIGWSAWSGRTDVLLNAGAYVNAGGVWRRALPWVKTGGVWKIAQPTIPVSGTWRVPKS